MTTVCVTGMHRSGTSFAARALQLLGVSLGDPDQLMAAGPDNAAGYWENRPLKEFDDELLAELGGSWDQPPVLDPGWEDAPELGRWRDRAGALLKSAFGNAPFGGRADHQTVAWKDPRLCLLMPFWRTVTPITTTVVIVRDPHEVAASLRRRNGLGPSQSALLWLRYLLAAQADDPGRLLLTQNAFFDDLPDTLHQLVEHLDLSEPPGGAEAAIAAHLDPSLLHAADPDTGGDPLSTLASQVWNGGVVATDWLPPAMVDALARGWLRPPVDGEILARARAKVVKLQATMQRRGLQKKSLNAERAAIQPRDDAVDRPAGPQS